MEVEKVDNIVASGIKVKLEEEDDYSTVQNVVDMTSSCKEEEMSSSSINNNNNDDKSDILSSIIEDTILYSATIINNSAKTPSPSLEGAAVAALLRQNPTNRVAVVDLIRVLTNPDRGLYPRGVAPKELFEFVCKLPDEQRVSKTRNHLQVLLWRDVKLGKICRINVGLYTVPEFLQNYSPQSDCSAEKFPDERNDRSLSPSSTIEAVVNDVTCGGSSINTTATTSNAISATIPPNIEKKKNKNCNNGQRNLNNNNNNNNCCNVNCGESDNDNNGDNVDNRLNSVIEAVSSKMELWNFVDETVAQQHEEIQAEKLQKNHEINGENSVDNQHQSVCPSPPVNNNNGKRSKNGGNGVGKKKRKLDDQQIDFGNNKTKNISPTLKFDVKKEIINDTVNGHCDLLEISTKNNNNSKNDNSKINCLKSPKAEIGLVSSSTPSTSSSALVAADSSKSKKKKIIKKQPSVSDDVSTSYCNGIPQTQSASADDKDECFFCQMSGSENIFGQPENFIRCKDCRFKAHPSCLGYTAELADRCRAYPWQCFDCKVCSRCMSSDCPETMLMCDNCDRSYHMKCHSPIVQEKPGADDKWICSECVLELRKKQQISPPKIAANKKNKVDDLTGDKRTVQIQNTVNSVSIADLNRESESIDAQLDKFTLPAIEDNPLIKKAAIEAKMWTVDQVYTFISQLGFSEQANAFKREEIDGQALLLLKRNDVLSMLSLKLGPALKIHRRLAVLQSMVCGCDINELEDK